MGDETGDSKKVNEIRNNQWLKREYRISFCKSELNAVNAAVFAGILRSNKLGNLDSTDSITAFPNEIL